MMHSLSHVKGLSVVRQAKRSVNKAVAVRENGVVLLLPPTAVIRLYGALLVCSTDTLGKQHHYTKQIQANSNHRNGNDDMEKKYSRSLGAEEVYCQKTSC